LDLHAPPLRILLAMGSLLGAAAVFSWRLRETTRPIDARRILIPPLGMSTGFAMFLYPPARIPMTWACVAFLFGALVLCYPLARSSALVLEGDDIRLRRSPAFLWILAGLVAARLLARSYVERYVSPLQTGATFFVLAFGMILPWRVRMYREFQRLVAERDRRSSPARGEAARDRQR
jgi:membrane protein CcdC involved in cytochrome C biogenesis